MANDLGMPTRDLDSATHALRDFIQSIAKAPTSVERPTKDNQEHNPIRQHGRRRQHTGHGRDGPRILRR
jgi:hypothetical protein